MFIVDANLKLKSQNIFNDIIRSLKIFGFKHKIVRFQRYKKSHKRKPEYAWFRATPQININDIGPNDTIVLWWAKNLTKDLDMSPAKKMIFFQGPFKNSWICDKGLFGESILCEQEKFLDPYLTPQNIRWGEKFAFYNSQNNISKRKQSKRLRCQEKGFIFLPMQHMDDIAITKYCEMSYENFMFKVAHFSKNNKIKLIIKKHPEFLRPVPYDSRMAKHARAVKKTIKKVQKIIGYKDNLTEDSIHHLCQSCLFMAGMNTAADIDAFSNKCVVSHCGQSIFMHSNGVIHDNDIERGLSTCLNMSDNAKKRLFDYQKTMLYFLYNKYLLMPKKGSFQSDLTNRQKIVNMLNRI